MQACWKAAGLPVASLKLLGQLNEDDLVLKEENYRQIWVLDAGSEFSLTVDADSGALLSLGGNDLWKHFNQDPPPGLTFEEARSALLARVAIDKARALSVAREFLETAYPEFATRPFGPGEAGLQSDHEGAGWLILYRENHGTLGREFTNKMGIWVDAFSGSVVSFVADYIRVEAEPIPVTWEEARRSVMVEGRNRGGAQGSVLSCDVETLELIIEPASKSSANAFWRARARSTLQAGPARTRALDVFRVNAVTGETRHVELLSSD